MALKVNAQQYAEKWARRLSQSTEDIRTGVERVTEAPGIAAARKEDKMLAGITEAVRSGKWARAVAGVSLEEWRTATLDKGIGRISQGVQSAIPKQVEMATRLLSAIETVKNRVDSMPDITLEDRIAKSAAFQRGMAEASI